MNQKIKLDKKALVEIAEKKGKTKDDVKVLYTEFEKFVNERYKNISISPAEKEDNILRLVLGSLSKTGSAKKQEYEGVFIGDGGVTDFGAANLYKTHKEQYEENPQLAIENGYCNAKGEPIYITPEFKKGQLIDVELAKKKTLWFDAKKVGDKDTVLTSVQINAMKKITPEKYETIEIKVPENRRLKFSAVPAKKSPDGMLSLYGNDDIKFEVVDDKEIDFRKIYDTTLKNIQSSLVGLEEFFNDKAENDRQKLIAVKGDVRGIYPDKEGRGFSIRLSDLDLDLESGEESKSVGVWVSDYLPEPDFNDTAIGVHVFGKVTYNEKKGTYGITAFKVWCPPEWRNNLSEPVKSIDKDVTKKEDQEENW